MERKNTRNGTIFRAAGWNVWLFCCASVMALCMVAAAASGGIGTAVLFAPLAAGCVWFAVRVLRSGVVVSDDALTVRGQVRTLRVPWSDVVAVEAGPSGNVAGGRCVIVELVEGKAIRVRGVSGFSGDVDRAAREIAELRPAALSSPGGRS